MKVQVFAALKEYFDAEFELKEYPSNIKGLKEHLIALHPGAAGLINACRFAVNEALVGNEYRLRKGDLVCVFPPPGGGQ